MSTTPSPPTSTPAQPQPPSQAEIEYRSLTTYFEKLVGYLKMLVTVTYGAIVLVLAIAGVFLWKNTSEVKSEAAGAIEATKQSANQQIGSIGKEASAVAQSEAKKAIEATLEKQNIQRLIERTAQEKVGSAVEQQIQRDLGPKIDAFRNLITEVGEISNHGAQLRLGFRPGLEYLLKKMDSPDPTVKAYAKSTLVQIASDYEAVVSTRFPIGMPGGPTSPLAALIPPPNTPKSAKELMMTIRTMPETHTVAAAFMEMKKLVAWDVQTFDIPAAEKWCASHKPRCDQ
jgi:hypothetical protein